MLNQSSQNMENEVGCEEDINSNTSEKNNTPLNEDISAPFADTDMADTDMPDTEVTPSKQKLKDVIRDMHHKLDSLNGIWADITSIKNDVAQLIASVNYTEDQLSDACKKIEIIKKENTILKNEATTQSHQNSLMMERIVAMDDYSRRENIVITGINESRGENCMFMVQDLFQHMGFEHIFLQRCHRVGPRRQGNNRDMLVRLLHFPDKIMIHSSRSKFPKGIYINDDYSMETKRKINILRPVHREAKKIDSTSTLFKDKLYFKNKEYTVKNIRSINLDTEKLSQKSSKDVMAFAGRFSPLSNHYPCPVDVDGMSYASSEHCYQHQKCTASGNHVAAAAVLLTTEPEDAMAAGSSVRQTPEWTQKEGMMIMEKALRAKFSPQHMKAKLRLTGKRQLAEATWNKLWGIGQPFTSPNVLQPATYSGQNLLGSLLMKLRDEI